MLLFTSPYVEATAPEFATLDLKGQRSAGDEKFGRQISPCWIRFN